MSRIKAKSVIILNFLLCTKYLLQNLSSASSMKYSWSATVPDTVVLHAKDLNLILNL